MKFFPALLTYFSNTASRRNVKSLFRFLAVLALMICLFATVFHALMDREGQRHSWATAVYWTLTVMSTLGFGDITFHSDAGRLFSIVVLLSGMIFLLILLPFTLIEFFYAPWIRAQRAALARREVPEETSGHVIITNFTPVTRTLIRRLTQYGYSYVLLVEDLEKAIEMRDAGFETVVGDCDDPDTYGRLRVEHAAMVVAAGTDTFNTNVAFTVRELSENVSIVTTAQSQESVDILELAGSTKVLRLDDMMGRALARHASGGDAEAHILGHFDQIQIAEATTTGTPLIGKTLAEAKLRENLGVVVIGAWERGQFTVAGPDTKISASTVLLLAGSEEQIAAYSALFCIYHVATAPVVVIGGGRVGRAAARFFEGRNTDCVIIERLEERVTKDHKYVHGSAAELETLVTAGFREAPAVILTTHEDDTNIYLTIYCRRLREDIQIVARSVREKNVHTLHRAGADFVLSYATMGANAIFNVLKRGEVLLIAEGLNVFRMALPPGLEGRSLADAQIRTRTGCHVIGVRTNEGTKVNPDPSVPLEAGSELILVSSPESQDEFLKTYGRPEDGGAGRV